MSRRSNRRHFSVAFHILVLISISIAFLVGVAHLPFLSVQSVRISGESDISPALQQEVRAYVDGVLGSYYRYIIPGTTRYLFKEKEIERNIQGHFLYIDTADIENNSFNVRSLTLKKRDTFGTYCNASTCFLIDTNGLVFDMTETIRIGQKVVVVGDIDVGEYLFMDTASDDRLSAAGEGEGESAGMSDDSEQPGAEYIHNTDSVDDSETGAADFRKISDILTFLEERELFADYISLRKGSRDVHIQLLDGIGVWVNTTETLHDIIRALYVTFDVTFPDEESRSEVSSIVLCDSQKVFWTPGDPWEKGCNVQTCLLYTSPSPRD